MTADRQNQIVVVRHGATEWSDARRHTGRTDLPLTDEGREQARAVGRLLEGQSFALVLTSPWLRAAQTAEILVEVARVPQPAMPCEPLATDPDLIRLTDFAGGQPPEAIVAIVGHSPWMEELASVLLGGSTDSIRMDFPKSGVMGIELEALAPGAGELRFFLRPKML